MRWSGRSASPIASRSPACCRFATCARRLAARGDPRAAQLGIGDLGAVHVAVEAVRIPGARPADRRVRSSRDPRSADARADRAARAARTIPRRSPRALERLAADAALAASLGRAARDARARLHVGTARAGGSRPRSRLHARHDFAGAPRRRAVPGLRPPRSNSAASVRCVRVRTRLPRARGYLDLRPQAAFAEQTRVSRRGAARRRAARVDRAAGPRLEDPQRHAPRVPGAGAGRSRRRSRLRQRTRARLERRPRRGDGRHRHQPVLRARGGRALGPRARRSPAPAAALGRVHEGLVARRARASLAGGAARDARRGEPRARRRRRAVHLHARAEERMDRRRRAAGQPASRALCERVGLHRSAAGTAAQVRPPQPARRPRRPARGCWPNPASGSSASPTTRRSSARSSRTSWSRMAERLLVRGAARRPGGRAGADAADSIGAARRRRRAFDRRGLDLPRARRRCRR